EIEGGATLGYCATGSCVIDSDPSTMMRMETTQAKMGRLIKNCAIVLPQLGFDLVSRSEAGDGANGTAFTMEPGGAFCDPSTMMLSLAFNPFDTTTLSPMMRSTSMARGSTLFSLLTISTVDFPPAPRAT